MLSSVSFNNQLVGQQLAALSKSTNDVRRSSNRIVSQRAASQTLDRRLTLTTSAQASEHPHDVISRRDTLVLSVGAAVASMLTAPQRAEAAYGEGARVFATTKSDTDFRQVEGNGYTVLAPSKWNPNKSLVEGSDVRFADNMRDDGANMDVIVKNQAKGSSIQAIASLEDFLSEVTYLLGTSASFDGETQSEGGFDANSIATGALLESEQRTDRNGRVYYTYHILTRTADGEGGGRHHLFSSTVANGKLYTLQAQALDKQWFKGSEKVLRKVMDSFTVA
mmetsp:Transcript_36689/g.44375  ORF Transcript_36689/g.44375 Transcript_36689/m.44375 type:complete len:279 (+) Transcript_36689:123-959(+)|eukprot:CAMPEP_0197865198 /NCGR_PEP_ID=MMETSP1438-20131217/43524_1 /TAXON_ID=1461541 /ORGANISM="Pterosperma sp., Strain CCMP1384" /LENGTH=278 /DNA_ID=CAMNT_0043483623 /DNA_START=100 /DNA_END=936 /DNA_ORIENTATION=+